MLRIGIAGMGFIGQTHYEAARSIPEMRVVAVASARADEVHESYPELEVVSYEDLYRDRRLDAILVCLPTFLHERSVIDALTNGRHVLCEKPLALDADSAARIVSAVKEAGVTFMVSQVLRFWPQYVRMRELVKSGALGALHSVNSYRLATYPPWSEWFREPAKSGGCLLDLQVHDVDFIFWMLGKPRKLYSLGLKSSTGAWDHVVTSLSYERAIAQIESSYLMPDSWPLSAGMRIAGSNAVIEYSFRSAGDVNKKGKWEEQLTLFGSNETNQQVKVGRVDVFAAQLKHFAACIENPGTTPICPPEESYAVMQLLSASKQSAETGEEIRL